MSNVTANKLATATRPVTNEIKIIMTMAAALQAIRETPVSVRPVSDFNIDRTRNYREDSDYEGDTLAQDMRESGQQEPVIGTMEGEKILIIRGYRRVSQFKLAEEKNLLFIGGPYAGKEMALNVEVKILPTLDPAIRAELHMDHSQRKSLTKIGLFRAYEEGKTIGKSDRDLVVKLADLFNTHFPPTRPIVPVTTDNGTDLLDNHKGTVDAFRALWQGPTMLKDGYFGVLKGTRNWPKQGEMKALSKVFTDEKAKAPISAGITRDKPGPLFLAKWAQLEAKYKDAASKGQTRRATTMMPVSLVEALTTQRESGVLRLDAHIILRDCAEDTNARLDAFMTKLENSWDKATREEWLAILNAANVIAAVADATAAPVTDAK